MCDLIEYLPREVLARKYKNELHANEVAILPYYIANLNIETKMGRRGTGFGHFRKHCGTSETFANILHSEISR